MTREPDRLEDALAEIKQLRAEVERLTAENKQLRDDFWKERERIDGLRAEVKRLKAENKALREEIDSLAYLDPAPALEPGP